MSQIGIEGNIESDTENASFWNLPEDFYFSQNFPPDDPASNVQRVTVLLAFSVLGLLGNFLTVLLVMVTKQLQRANNSFFVHHCILDMIKSAYCCVFSKSLLSKEPASDCSILGASYIVFVTTSAFNLLAITVNEIYYFTNEIVGTQSSSKCCVLFGLGITWFASVIINLGVAFLPGHSSFDRTVGYCTFIYGVTGNYLLHVLWIVLITLSLLLTVLYLRKFWHDIRKRAYHRIATVFQHTLCMQYEGDVATERTKLREKYIQKTIGVGKKNFFLLVVMVTLFILLWYPLFLLTLSDPSFRADARYYKTLTIVAWCHSSLTPVFFIAYNVSSIKDLQEKLIWKYDRTASTHSLGTPSPRTYHLTSDSGSTPCSPQRPSSLNVTPVYHCHHHLSSGTCVESECSPARLIQEEKGENKTIPIIFNNHKRNSLAAEFISAGPPRHKPTPSPHSLRSSSRTGDGLESIWLKRVSYDTINIEDTGDHIRRECEDNSGHTCRSQRMGAGPMPLNTPQLADTELFNKTNSRIEKRTSTCPLIDENYNDKTYNQQMKRRIVQSCSLTIPTRETLLRFVPIPRVLTLPNHMASADHMTDGVIDHMQPSHGDRAVQVDEHTTPACQLAVHRVSTGCVTAATGSLLTVRGNHWV